jgi:hypothetical protein
VKPSAARETQQQADDQDAERDKVEKANAARQHPFDQHQHRPDQERSEYVRVLEAAKGAVVLGEKIVRMREQAEIAGGAGKRGEDCGQHVGRAHRCDSRHRVTGEEAGEQHRRQRQID